MSIVAPSPTSVYQYRDANDILIYVGITSRGARRQDEHNADKHWWPLVASQSVEHYGTRREAAARERELIGRHMPPFNTQHNPNSRLSRDAYMQFLATQVVHVPLPEAVAALPEKRLELSLHEMPGVRSCVFRTFAEDAQIARALRLDETVRAYGFGKPASVQRIEHVGPFALLWLNREARWPVRDAWTAVRCDVKAPLKVVRMRSLQVRLDKEAIA